MAVGGQRDHIFSHLADHLLDDEGMIIEHDEHD